MSNVYADETEINSSKTLDDLFIQGTWYDFILFVTHHIIYTTVGVDVTFVIFDFPFSVIEYVYGFVSVFL